MPRGNGTGTEMSVNMSDMSCDGYDGDNDEVGNDGQGQDLYSFHDTTDDNDDVPPTIQHGTLPVPATDLGRDSGRYVKYKNVHVYNSELDRLISMCEASLLLKG